MASAAIGLGLLGDRQTEAGSGQDRAKLLKATLVVQSFGNNPLVELRSTELSFPGVPRRPNAR